MMKLPPIENDPFTEEARRILDAAAGYLELGMIDEANQELEEFSPEFKTSREVLRLRALIYGEIRSWELMCEVSRFLVSEWPEESDHWIWLAFATRRCRSIADAEIVLLDAKKLHDPEPMIDFNLACYAAQTERLTVARERLARAIKLDPGIRAMALDDPDLMPLWKCIGNI